jgi:formate dehydrogenase major subunit
MRMSNSNTFTIDRRDVDIRVGETIFQAARRLDIKLPHLCYSPKPGYRPDGNCRVCMVEIEGERVLAASCIRTPTPGMKVKTDTHRAETARKMVLELLAVDQPPRETSHDPQSEFWKTWWRHDMAAGRFPRREAPGPDRSHPAMAVNLDACIQCNLCVRACREVQVNDVIGMAGRGHAEKIVFDFDDPMGDSTCVACGECVQACPTGALMPATLVNKDNVRTPAHFPDRSVDSVCPYCGVGCQLTYHIKDDKLLYVSGQNGPANENRLCVKGRFGFDYVHNPQRLTQPMIRKEGVPKIPHEVIDPMNPWTATALRRSPASAPPRRQTRKPICSRSWCARASALTMSTIARGSATLHRWRRCSKASAPARSRRLSTRSRIPTSSW